MLKDEECDYPGVGRLSRRNGLWYWITFSGKSGGPTKDKDGALKTMETKWHTDMRDAAQLNAHSGGARYPMPDAAQLDPGSRRYNSGLVETWQAARVLACRRWGC